MASRISATTVVHHQTDAGEHWTVLTGATVVAYCTNPDQAVRLAGTLNQSRRAGDQYELTTPYASLVSALPAAPKPARCQGLRISPTPSAGVSLSSLK